MNDPLVVFKKISLANPEQFLGCIHLNAPKSYNALNLEMVRLIQSQLNAWRDDESLALIFLDAEGEKAFCAGGDVKSLYNGQRNTETGIENPTAIEFFNQEYTLNYTMHTYPKPIICWANGVVMGGGLGLMLGCTHRIVTETTRSAMPEITIGLFPDVGSSWFLNRCPGKIGLFLGLTGVSINAHDAIYAGLANRFISNDNKSAVIDALLTLDATQIQCGEITKLLKNFENKSKAFLPMSELKHYADLVEVLCDFESIEEIAETIISLCKNHNSSWLQSAALTLEKGCPITAHLVFQQLARAKHLSLEQVFIMERNISAQCMKQPDFYEGVRALLIDKDKSPVWTHKKIVEVDAEFLDSYF